MIGDAVHGSGASWFAKDEWVVDRYLLVDELGSGGMGVVWRAEDRRMGRAVAVKTLRHSGRGADEVRRRFQREVEISAALRHPRIMAVYDAGESRGFPYLVMELIEGRSLSQIIADGELPSLPVAVPLLRRLAQALEHAHDHGVLHRDIKPANVMLDEQGLPKLCDFGIACRRDGKAEVWETEKGVVVGTPDYMAPEVRLGRGRDYPADFYAFGCIAFELLTGRRRTHFPAVPPAPSSLRPGVPASLDGLVLRLLADDPAARPGSADQIVALLDELSAVLLAERGRKTSDPGKVAARLADAERFEEMSEYIRAAEVYRQLADSQEAAGGRAESTALTSRFRAAQCLLRAQEYGAAKYEFEKVVEVGTRLNGAEHSLTLDSLSGIAYCLSAKNEHHDALTYYVEVSERHARLGPDGPQAVAARYDLARCRCSLRDYTAAYQGFVEVAAKRMETSDQLQSRCWAAYCLHEMGNYREAAEEYRKLLPLCEQEGEAAGGLVQWLKSELARRPDGSWRIGLRRRPPQG